MKLNCPCGATIHDNTDFLPYKARLLADADSERFMVALETGRFYWDTVRRFTCGSAYQCTQCRRIHVLREGKAFCFAPEGETADVFGSATEASDREPRV
jgi:hypothetical protein